MVDLAGSTQVVLVADPAGNRRAVADHTLVVVAPAGNTQVDLVADPAGNKRADLAAVLVAGNIQVGEAEGRK